MECFTVFVLAKISYHIYTRQNHWVNEGWRKETVKEPALQGGSLGTGTYHTSLSNELNPQETLKGEKGKRWGGKERGAGRVALLVECLPLQHEDLTSDPSPHTTVGHGALHFNPSTVEGAEAEPWSSLISQSHQWQISIFSERPWHTHTQYAESNGRDVWFGPLADTHRHTYLYTNTHRRQGF